MLFDLELALVVKQTVQYKGGITIGALNRQAVEGGVIIGHEGVKLQGEVAESGAVGLLEHPARQRETLPVACRGPAQREEVSRSVIALTNSAKALRCASSVRCQSPIRLSWS